MMFRFVRIGKPRLTARPCRVETLPNDPIQCGSRLHFKDVLVVFLALRATDSRGLTMSQILQPGIQLRLLPPRHSGSEIVTKRVALGHR